MSELKYTAIQMNNVLSNSQEYYTNWREAEKINKELRACIAKLEGFIDRLIEAGDAMSNAQSMWVAEEDKWNALVKDWKERE